MPDELAPAAEESRGVRFLRRSFQRYRDGSIRIGHPFLRRLLRSCLGQHQCVRLRSGLLLELDLTIPLQETAFWTDGDLEPQLSWAVRELLPRGGVFVDCGANFGLFGLEARLHQQARVVFLEPHPRLAATIRRNVALNGWSSGCQVLEAAASDSPGTAEFFLSTTNDGAHSLLGDWHRAKTTDPTLQVPVVTLAVALWEQLRIGHVDFLKVDTEGQDFKVLRGLGDRLRPEFVTLLYTELGRDRADSIQLLQSRGYVGFAVRRFHSGVETRRAGRAAEQGFHTAFFLPTNHLDDGSEVLWCPEGSTSAARIRQLAQGHVRT